MYNYFAHMSGPCHVYECVKSHIYCNHYTTRALSLSRSLALSRACACGVSRSLSLFLSLTHTHTHTRSLTHSPSRTFVRILTHGHQKNRWSTAQSWSSVCCLSPNRGGRTRNGSRIEARWEEKENDNARACKCMWE